MTATDEDMPRLNAACLAVYKCIRNLDRWELPQLAAATGYTEASCSARLRQIRAYLHVGNKGTVLSENLGRGKWIYSLRLYRYSGAA